MTSRTGKYFINFYLLIYRHLLKEVPLKSRIKPERQKSLLRSSQRKYKLLTVAVYINGYKCTATYFIDRYSSVKYVNMQIISYKNEISVFQRHFQKAT